MWLYLADGKTCHALQYTYSRGAHRYDSSTCFARLANQFSGGSIQVNHLAVHFMISIILALDRSECIQSHMQRYKTDTYPLFAQIFQQVRCKMQASRGSGCRTTDAGIDRLVALWIGQCLVNIWRQRHASQAFDKVPHGYIRCIIDPKTYNASPGIGSPEDFCP